MGIQGDRKELVEGVATGENKAQKVWIGDASKAEDVAHASGDIGLFVLGVRADTAAALGGTDGDYVPLIFDANGRLHVNGVLAAGTALVGKVGIDQTTPGTTNKVVVGASLDGAGAPTVDSYTSAVIDLAASTANQVLVAAPGASKQIWVYGIACTADTAAGTIVFQDEDDTALSGTMAFSDEGGMVIAPSGNFAMPIFKVPTAKALEADTGACTVDGILSFAIISV